VQKPSSGFSTELHRVVGSIPTRVPPRSLDSITDAAIVMARRRRSGEDKPVVTPWAPFNDTLGGGLWAGAHFIVAGTGVGKSQLTFQLAARAASNGTPVGLIALELDETQLVLRLAAEGTGVPWSTVYTGKCSPEQLLRVEASAQKVRALPIMTDFGEAMGWGYERLELMAQTIRATHPTGPFLIVLDFIQLISSPPGEKETELRERIGRAGYAARNVSRKYGASVVIISSTARQNYGALNAKLSKAGIGIEPDAHSRGGKLRRRIRYPDELIGLGKESGELEFSADSLSVIMRPTLDEGRYDSAVAELLARGGKLMLLATPKVRAGIPSWFALGFEQGRFSSLSDETCNSIVTSVAEDSEEIQELILAYMRANPIHPVPSLAGMAKAISRRKDITKAALEELVSDNVLEKRPDGYWMAKSL
jgi:DnaB helicase-like protein